MIAPTARKELDRVRRTRI